MVGTKEGKFLVFNLDNGKSVKYDLSTCQLIGVKGEPVKSLSPRFSKMGIEDIINSIDSENYRNFLLFVYEKNNKISNFGTLLKKAKKYSSYEQVFSSGVKLNPNFYGSIPPKNFIIFCKKYNIRINRGMYTNYKEDVDFANLLFSLETNEFTKKDKEELLDYGYYYDKVKKLISKGYNRKSIILYMDYLMTHEALDLRQIMMNFPDYVSMMSTISSKFDKYPRNLLTSHEIARRNYNRMKQEYPEELFKRRINLEMEFSYKGWKIIYPKSTQDIKDEATQQHHCVASYIDKVIDGETDILFLRRRENEDESLVTMEVRNGKIVQARGRFNRDVTEQEKEVINKYNEYLQNIKK